MHFDYSADLPRGSRSRLGMTLQQLHRNLEASRRREQAAFELFEAWQARWANHREVIARHLECLDRELEDLSISAIPSPHLSLLAMSESHEEHHETAADIVAMPDSRQSE